MSPINVVWLFLLALTVVFAVLALSKIIVNVGAGQIAILEKRFVGSPLAAGRVFALGDEVGIQAEDLPPGLHFISGRSSGAS